MRTRTVSTPVSLSPGSFTSRDHDWLPAPPTRQNAVYLTTTGTTPAYVSTAQVDDSSNTITDELSGSKREGYCKHVVRKHEITGLGPAFTFWAFNTAAPAHWVEITVVGDYIGYNDMRTRIPALHPNVVFSTIDWEQCSYGALQEMRPKFSDMSLANDVLEIRQIADLCRPFGKIQKVLGRDGRSLLSKLSNLLLWKKFGVDPTVQSLLGVCELIRKLPDKIADLRRRGKRLQTRHYSRPMDIGGQLPADGELYSGFTTSDYRYTVGSIAYTWRQTPVYHATLKFRYAVEQLTDVELMVRAWLEAAGLNRLASVVWNAIPFSFVVDWFVNVGDCMESLLHDPAIPIVIEDFSHSVKYSYRADVTHSMYKGACVFPIAYGETSYYERRRDIPATYSRLEFVPIRESSLVLGAALIGQAAGFRKESNRRRKLPRVVWVQFDRRTLLR